MTGFFNNMKTTVLMAGLMGLALGIAYLIGGPDVLLPTLAIAAVFNLAIYFYSDRIALATMRAVPVTEKDDPQLWRSVERLSDRAGIPMPRVYMSPASAPNAFATGRNPRHSAVCVTVGLRQLLNQEELDGVIAHELSHIRNRDVLISTVAAIIGTAITYLAYVAIFFGDRRRNPFVGLLLFLFAPLAAGLIRMAISRSREYEADRRGAEIAGSPRGLASALRRLDSQSRRIPLPVPDSQSNMFIVHPFTGRNVSKLFMTHPPVEDRIRRLMELDR